MANGVMFIVPASPFRVVISNCSDKPLRFHKNTNVGLVLPTPCGIFSVEETTDLSGHVDAPSSEEGETEPIPTSPEDEKTKKNTWKDTVHIGNETTASRDKVMELLSDFEDIWSGQLGNISAARHRIDLTPDAKPVY